MDRVYCSDRLLGSRMLGWGKAFPSLQTRYVSFTKDLFAINLIPDI